MLHVSEKIDFSEYAIQADYGDLSISSLEGSLFFPQNRHNRYYTERNPKGEEMNRVKKTIARWVLTLMGGTILLGTLSSIGCTVHSNGMTLPSPQWTKQRVNYFPTGPQYPLSKEESMMKEMKAENTNW